MTKITCWVKNTVTGEITEVIYTRAVLLFLGKDERFVTEAEYVLYKIMRQHKDAQQAGDEKAVES